MEGRSTTRIHLGSGGGVELAKRTDRDARAARRILRRRLRGPRGRRGARDPRDELRVRRRAAHAAARHPARGDDGPDPRPRPREPGRTRTLFEDQVSLGLDFEQNRFAGLIPGFGDWNGDGLLDLVVGRGRDAIGFRLGSREPGAARFGSAQARQPVPLASGATRIADLDGDGLDDIVAFDASEPEPPLVVLENLGRLPGSPSSLRPR